MPPRYNLSGTFPDGCDRSALPGFVIEQSACTMNDAMLTVASLGMLSYGAYEVGWAVVDLIRGPRLELWAELGLMMFGLLLVLAADFVRVRLPGGLPFAIGALLGLQALAVHSAAHLDAGLARQIGRGVLAVVLVGLAYVGQRSEVGSQKSEV